VTEGRLVAPAFPPGAHLSRGHGVRDRISLEMPSGSGHGDHVVHQGGLDPFENIVDSEGRGEVDQGKDKLKMVDVSIQRPDEALIDLDLIDGQGLEAPDGGVSRSDIVEGDPVAGFLQGPDAFACRGLVEESRLDDLEGDLHRPARAVGGEAAEAVRLQPLEKASAGKGFGGKVDRDPGSR